MYFSLLRRLGGPASFLWSLHKFGKGADEMTVVKRLKRIASTRLDRLFDSIEDPKTVYPHLLKELEHLISVAEAAATQADADCQTAQTRIDKVEAGRTRYQRGARLALDQNDDDTSRQALRVDLELEAQLVLLREEHTRRATVLTDTQNLLHELKTDLSALRDQELDTVDHGRLNEIEGDLQRAAARLKGQSSSLLDLIAQAGGKIKKLAGSLDAAISRSEITELDHRLKVYEREHEVDQRMSQMRQDTVSD